VSAPRSRRRGARGHVLVEAMASSAILLWALAGLVAGLLAGAKLLGTASRDRVATEVVAGQVERLRAMPVNSSAWVAGTSDAGVAGHPTWDVVTVVVDELDADAGTAAPLSYKRAVVTISYGGSTYSEEIYK
jgi:hypothetical protein